MHRQGLKKFTVTVRFENLALRAVARLHLHILGEYHQLQCGLLNSPGYTESVERGLFLATFNFCILHSLSALREVPLSYLVNSANFKFFSTSMTN